jgi:hypothetical protein
MGAQTIKRDAFRQEKRMRQRLKSGGVATVSIAQDTTTGEILAVGVDHTTAVRAIPLGRDGCWEVKEYQVCR